MSVKKELLVKKSKVLQQKQRFKGKLYDYQQKVVEWAQKLELGRGLLALDMGLGKTVTTLAIICLNMYKKCLVIVPLCVLDQWRGEIEKFTRYTSDTISIYQGKHRKQVNLEKAKIVLTTYDVVIRDLDRLDTPLSKWQSQFDCVVLDEAQKVINPRTTTHKTCLKLVKQCNHRWLLTGTAIINKFNDLVSLSKFMDNQTELKEDLKQWRDKYYYRLTKKDSRLVLPEKTVKDHYLEFDYVSMMPYIKLSNQTRRAYLDYLEERTQDDYSVLLVKILRLRQCCNHPNSALSKEAFRLKRNRQCSAWSPKFNKAIEIIKNTPVNDKIIIFSQWGHNLSLFAKCLDQKGITHSLFNGKMNKNDKTRTLENFRKNNVKVILITTTAGAVGINLTCANHVIIMDSWWNMALENQAIDRAHRIGQEKPVFVHKLYMKDTIEHWMHKIKQEKHLVDLNFHNNCSLYEVNRGMLIKLLHRYTRGVDDCILEKIHRVESAIIKIQYIFRSHLFKKRQKALKSVFDKIAPCKDIAGLIMEFYGGTCTAKSYLKTTYK
jgi:SNF2 family DNA or RNA helicase